MKAELLFLSLLKCVYTQKNILQQTVKRESDPKVAEVNRNGEKNSSQMVPCWGYCTQFKGPNAILGQGL